MSTPLQSPLYPRRHFADQVRARRAAKLMLMQIPGGAQEQDNDPDIARLGQGLTQGDALADQLVAWMRSTDQRAAWAMVGQALDNGVSAVADAPTALKDFFEHVEKRPAWVREDLLTEGARVCALGGLGGMRVLLVTGLMAGYQLAAINETLLATGALEKGAARRLAETTKWWMDVTTPQAMSRFGSGFKNTVRVRLIHAMVRSHVGQQTTWDAADLGLPVNQTDMQATYLGFSVVYLLGMKLIGVPMKKDERQALMHLWRYIAWVNGVDESLLHNLEHGERSGLVWLYKNLLTQRMADHNSIRLAQSLAEEPLAREYGRWSWIEGPYNKALQLSLARMCMSNETLRALGLPVWTIPWYPMMMIPFNGVLHRVARLVPGGRSWLMARGRTQQLDSLSTLFGKQAPALRDISAVKVA
ncbi:MAG: oxygenase MpaB family protein [Aquabacterium sp.]|nr:oxygenase MpaB family protein [Aquabacterium sp.]